MVIRTECNSIISHHDFTNDDLELATAGVAVTATVRDVISSRAAAVLVDVQPGSGRVLHPFTFGFCFGGFRVFWRFWWGEHCACRWFPYKEGVGGSSPSTPTGTVEGPVQSGLWVR